jgi:hypothetical protein
VVSVSYKVDASILKAIDALAWCSTKGGYLKSRDRHSGNIIMMHHLAWILYGGCDRQQGVIDHIDRDPTNNASSNLRLITYRGNALNTSSKCVRFIPSKKRDGTGTWGVRIKTGDGTAWARNYADEDTAKLVAKHKKESTIEREVIAYVS